MSADFASRIISWQKQHGRHDLPWQKTRDPYRIWLSEIMLQQTQVATVLPYYCRFLDRFPDIAALASASEDEVLVRWSGLGYYSRARNLHRAAQWISERHGGSFPSGYEAILALPGIGLSTAAAISAFAFGERRAILDGNVKRVFARQFGIEGYPGAKAVESRLWQLADTLLPETDVEPYTQGLMDLGATLCTRNRPACIRCPVTASCVARATQRTNELPRRKPAKLLPLKQTVMLIIRDGREVLLQKRPPIGVWASLWCFPEMSMSPELSMPPGRSIQEDAIDYCKRLLGATVSVEKPYPTLAHIFTHFRLDIVPLPVTVLDRQPRLAQDEHLWLTAENAFQAAIPTPVRKLLTTWLTRHYFQVPL